MNEIRDTFELIKESLGEGYTNVTETTLQKTLNINSAIKNGDYFMVKEDIHSVLEFLMMFMEYMDSSFVMDVLLYIGCYKNIEIDRSMSAKSRYVGGGNTYHEAIFCLLSNQEKKWRKLQ